MRSGQPPVGSVDREHAVRGHRPAPRVLASLRLSFGAAFVAAAFACASLLAFLAQVALVVKPVVERRYLKGAASRS